VIKAGAGTLESCTTCHGLLKPAPETVPPVALELHDLLTRPFSWEGIVLALGLAFGEWLSWVPAIGELLRLGAMAALVTSYFQIIDHVGRGRPGLPGPSDTVEDLGGVMATALRGCVCIALGALPMLVYVHLFRHGAPLHHVDAAIVLGLWCLGMLYMPAVLLAIVLTQSTAAAFWPPSWIAIARRAPRSYARLVALFLLAVVAYGLWTLVTSALIGWLPILGSLVVGTGANLILFVQASLVGGFLRRHAELFGWD
jgi:hypothetical protein